MFKAAGYLCAVFLLTACLGGCDSTRYSAEKRFWHASRDYNKLLRSQDAVSPVDYQRVIDKFREITIRYPMWPNSAQAQFNIGQLYAMQGNLSKGRDEFYVILKDYPENKDMCAKALFMIAMSYEKGDDWPKALEAFNKITSGYPETGSALQVPVHIAEYYKLKGKNEEASAAYSAAIEKYRNVISKDPNTYAALAALALAVTCYAAQEKWNEAVDYLDSLVSSYGNLAIAPKALFVESIIYEQKLNMPDKAEINYKNIIEKYSDTPFAKLAENQLTVLKKTK